MRLSLLLVAAVAGFLVLGGTTLAEKASDARREASQLLGEHDPATQSAAQISASEFLNLPKGAAQSDARAVLGEPEAKHRVTIERLEVECWYYGISRATGTYQLCFVGGKLSSKIGYGAPALAS
jgi:hypothetical protein